MTVTFDRLPPPPDGHEALRTGKDGGFSLFGPADAVQITHLIRGGNPSAGTLCGLSLFDRADRKADIAGWSRGGRISGPGFTQERCESCWAMLGRQGADT